MKVIRFVFVICFAVFCSASSIAQSDRKCSADHYRMQLEQHNPILNRLRQESDASIVEWKKNLEGSRKGKVVIPIVFHIIHNNGAENINDFQIIKAVSYLNAAFANTSPYNSPQGIDTEISFCLANQDPKGNPSNGINKVVSNLTVIDMDFDDAALKSLSKWPPMEYINVWVVRDINSSSLGNNIAGYANFPYAHGTPTDGIVIEASNLGNTKDGGVVLAHEMGHYFGLYHTFEEGCKNDDCMLNGDRVCDTPPDQSREQIQCGDSMNSCLSDTNSGFSADQSDHVQNFLDYNNPACMNQFTNGQKDRMMYFINKDRKSLLTSKGCEDECTNPIIPDISFSTFNPQPYEMVNVANNSQNGVTYNWWLNGLPFSNQKSPTFIFTNEGINIVLLQIIGTTPNCVYIDTFVINTLCSPIADYNPKITDCIENYTGQIFTYSGDPSTSIEWFLNGVKIGNSVTIVPNLKAGTNALKLVAKNKYCENAFTTLISVSCIEDCSNNVDDDNDGLIDCFDGDCCDKCENHYYDPCFSDQDCNTKKSFTIKQKWISTSFIGTNGTPIVGDLQHDGRTEIFMPGQLEVLSIDGQTGSTNYSILSGNVNLRAQPTIADVDNDGKGELLVIGSDNKLYCFEEDGVSLKFTSPNVVKDCCLNYINSWCNVADLNYDGDVEIIIGNKVINGQNGILLADGSLVSASEGIVIGGNSKVHGNVTIANILRDDDPRYPPGLEIVTGNQILSVDLNTGKVKIEVPYPSIGDSYGVASDFDGDNDLDVVTASSNKVIVWEGDSPTNVRNVFLPQKISSLPTICNLDDDKELEMVLCTENSFLNPGYIYALDNNFSIKWKAKIGEHSASGPVSFDFELDGKLEIVQRTDDSLYIFNGENGQLLFKDQCGSGTLQEHPTIADIDNDGFAELLVGCSIDPTNAYKGYLRAYEGADHEWPEVRPVWNQGLFYNTQINDDLTVPIKAQQFHIKGISNGLNGFNTAITKAEDPYVYNLKLQNLKYTVTCDPDFKLSIGFDVVNGSNKSIAFKDCFTVYKNEPNLSDSKIIKTKNGGNAVTLSKDDTLHVVIDLNETDINSQEDASYCIIINDLGLLSPPFNYPTTVPPILFNECNFTDNKLCFRYQPRPGPDKVIDQKSFIICEGDSVKVHLLSKWKSVQWYDNSTNDSITIKASGIFWVKAGDDMCNAKTDSFEIKFVKSGLSLALPDTIVLCNGNVETIEAQKGFESYRWNDGFPESTYTVHTKGRYILTAKDACGKVYRDTTIVVQKKLNMSLPDSILICREVVDTILTDNGFNRIDLFPYDNTFCSGCNTVRIVTDTSRWHYLTAYADDGCIAVDSIYVLKYGPPLYTFDKKNPCKDMANGSVKIITAPTNSIIWDNGTNNPSRANLLPGKYYFTITNIHSCAFYDSVSITESQPIKIDVKLEKPCPNDNNGSISLSTSGMNNLQYQWSNGKKTASMDQLKAAQYNLTITDENGCMFLDTINLINHDTISNSSKIIMPCNNDSTGAIILTSNSINNYKYLWNIGSNKPKIENIKAGTYSTTVTDNNGCSHVYDFMVSNKFTSIVVNDTTLVCKGDSILYNGQWVKDDKVFEKIESTCDTLKKSHVLFYKNDYDLTSIASCEDLNNGSIVVEGKNGKAISYKWQKDGVEEGDSLTNLFAGLYSITITDSLNCKQVLNVKIPIIVSDFYSIDTLFSKSAKNPIDLSLSNAGTISFIKWTPSNGLSCDDCINPSCNTDTTTIYTITLKDGDGCNHNLQTKVKIEDVDLVFPNVVSLSSERGNNSFEIKSKFPIFFDINIFDRWGSLVFSRSNVSNEDAANRWEGTLNGQPLLPAVYVYSITVEGQKTIWGTVTLVR